MDGGITGVGRPDHLGDPGPQGPRGPQFRNRQELVVVRGEPEAELRDGLGRASLMTSDLGYRYVEVNAEYTT